MSRPVLARASLLTGALALVVLSLAGCVKVGGDLDVAGDGSVSGVISMSMQKELLASMGVTTLEEFEEGMSSDLSGELGSDSQCEPKQTDTEFMLECQLAAVPASQMKEFLDITVAGDEITVAVVADESLAGGAAGEDSSGDLGMLSGALMPSMDLDVSFPGPVASVSGPSVTKTSDNTVNFAGTFDSLSGTAVGSATPAKSSSLLVTLLIFMGVLLVLVFAAAGVIMARARSKAAATPAPADGPVTQDPIFAQSASPASPEDLLPAPEAAAPDQLPDPVMPPADAPPAPTAPAAPTTPPAPTAPASADTDPDKPAGPVV